MTYCTKCGTIRVKGEAVCRTCGHEERNNEVLNNNTENIETINTEAVEKERENRAAKNTEAVEKERENRAAENTEAVEKERENRAAENTEAVEKERENRAAKNTEAVEKERENRVADKAIELSKPSPIPAPQPSPNPVSPQKTQKLMPQQPDSRRTENVLSNGWKVFLTAITLIVPFLGPVLGIIMSLIYLSSPNLDSKSYGKALLILTVAYIGIALICCLGFMFLSMAGYMADLGHFNNQIQAY